MDQDLVSEDRKGLKIHHKKEVEQDVQRLHIHLQIVHQWNLIHIGLSQKWTSKKGGEQGDTTKNTKNDGQAESHAQLEQLSRKNELIGTNSTESDIWSAIDQTCTHFQIMVLITPSVMSGAL